ncbi:MAG TPA: penicillin-binding transpeptidase domain-containing protein [Pseudonocardiaceae bacterium]|nr:penicillin-binding transpeptidase domain-containing protein [Pseudonocardiaceae bacterium]
MRLRRRPRPAGIPAVALVASVGLVAAACSSTPAPPDAQTISQDFLTALAGKNTATAAKWTASPAAAKIALDAANTALKPTSVTAKLGQVQVGNSTATAHFTLNWQLAQGATWADDSSMTLNQDKDGNWTVHWAPSVLSPKLGTGQQLVRATVPAAGSNVTGSDGSTLLAPSQTVSVVVYAAQAGNLGATAGSLATALGQFDNTITAQSIVDGATKAGAAGYTVVNLRESDYQQVKPQIYNLPGVHFPQSTKLLGQKNFGGAILPSLRSYADSLATDQAGLSVSVADAHGNTVAQLYTKPAGQAPAITSTLSSKAQSAAETALATVPQQAMAVVIQPSTGDILAVAANAPAVAAGDNPLTGLYPPGSTFKIATSSAALQTGSVNPNTPEQCPGTTTIEGRVIPNENQFNLGQVPLITAFAQSCNTTFSQVAAGLSADALPKAARQLGVGVDYTIPHFTTNTGSVPTDSDTLARADDGFGQGKDQVSVFSEALMAATVVHGGTPTPSLIKGDTTTAGTQPTPLPAQTQSSLQQMMRAVVTSGTGKPIANINPPVSGKTGTAQFGDGTHSHGWFTGFQGDLAFSFLLVDAGSSTPAVTVAGTFLNAYAG